MKIIKPLTLLILLGWVSCTSTTNKIEENHTPLISERCETGSLFTYQDKNQYRVYRKDAYSYFAYPMELNFFPIVGTYNKDRQKVIPRAYSLNQIDSLAFMSKVNLQKWIRINIDTSDYYYELRDSSLNKKYCFKAKKVLFKNTSKDKFFLQDRFRIKLKLQAKNDRNEWMDLHDWRKVGCGLEQDLKPEDVLFALAPSSSIESCFILEDGDFKTACRIKYEYYNRIDSSYIRTSKEGGHYRKDFIIENLEEAIYSPVFLQKVSRERIRKAKIYF